MGADDIGAASVLGLVFMGSEVLGVSVGVGDSGGVPPSVTLLLENIFGCLDVFHGVFGFSADANLIVKMSAGRSSGTPHITDVLTTRDPLADLDTNSGKVCVSRLNPEIMFYFDQSTVAPLGPSVSDDTVGGGEDVCAV